MNAIYEEILADIDELADCGNSASSADSNKLPIFRSYFLKDKDFGKHWTNEDGVGR